MSPGCPDSRSWLPTVPYAKWQWWPCVHPTTNITRLSPGREARTTGLLPQVKHCDPLLLALNGAWETTYNLSLQRCRNWSSERVTTPVRSHSTAGYPQIPASSSPVSKDPFLPPRQMHMTGCIMKKDVTADVQHDPDFVKLSGNTEMLTSVPSHQRGWRWFLFSSLYSLLFFYFLQWDKIFKKTNSSECFRMNWEREFVEPSSG